MGSAMGSPARSTVAAAIDAATHGLAERESGDAPAVCTRGVIQLRPGKGESSRGASQL